VRIPAVFTGLLALGGCRSGPYPPGDRCEPPPGAEIAPISLYHCEWCTWTCSSDADCTIDEDHERWVCVVGFDEVQGKCMVGCTDDASCDHTRCDDTYATSVEDTATPVAVCIPTGCSS
jgi:hypothetical protein